VSSRDASETRHWTDPRSGATRSLTLLVMALWALTVALGTFELVSGSGGVGDLGSIATFVGLVIGACVGAVLVIRVPGNPIGWLLLVGLGLISTLDTVLANLAPVIDGSAGVAWSQWISQMFFLSVVLSFVALMLLFPTGHLPSRRWRPVADLAVVVLVWGTAGVIFSGPFALGGTLADLVSATTGIVAVFCALVLLATMSLVLRFRRTTAVERQRLAWPAVAASVAGLTMVVGFLAYSAAGWDVVWYWAFIVNNAAVALLAVAIGMAVGRQHPPGVETASGVTADRWSGRQVIAVAGWPIAIVLTVVALALARSGSADDPLMTISQAAVTVATVTVGTILIRRGQYVRIGWLLWVGGLLSAIIGATLGLADHGLTVDPDSVPAAPWVAWLSQWIPIPSFWLLCGVVPLVYPSGRPASLAGRSILIIGTLIAGIMTAQLMLSAWPPGLFPTDNPLAGSDLAGNVVGLIGGSDFLLYVVVAAAVASLFSRYRQAAGIERAQLRWFAAVGVVAGPALVIGVITGGSSGTVTPVSSAAFLVVSLTLPFLPLAIGIAVLRYRLYEIDRIVSRTIGWAIVSAVLATVFVVVILVLQTALAQVTSSNTVAVATSTLVVFALFQPLRRRVQARVDRRFNRARYDAERTLAAFAGRLRDEVDLGQLRAEIIGTVDRTVQPTTVSVWLRR